MNNQTYPMPTPGDIAVRLITKYGFNDWEAGGLARTLHSMDADLQEAFAKWWWTGVDPDIVVEGFTMRSILDGKKIGSASGESAFSALSLLRQNPSLAKDYLLRGVP